MATQMEDGSIDLREQLARIDKIHADIQKTLTENGKLMAETKVVPFAAIFQGLIAIAGLLGAGAAITKLFFP
jgi:hypothetical protein